MEFIIGPVQPAQRSNSDSLKVLPVQKPGRNRDRRKRKQDRRRNVREGIFVSLSGRRERRRPGDRRRNPG